MRAFVQGSDLPTIVKNVKANAAMYPLSAAANPPKTKFVNFSGKQFNTVHANDFTFFEELNEVVQHEPDDYLESEVVGILATIGIKKGKPFAPDARMKAILTDAAAVANATSRAMTFASRDPLTKYYPDRQWTTSFTHLNHEFADGGERTLDARTMSFYYFTGLTPAMASPKLGQGAAYVYTARDGKGEYVDGSKNYKVTLPPNIPAQRFWSFNVYDNQHRSFLETDQKTAGLDSTPSRREEKRRRLGDGVVRPESARRPGRQLGPNVAGKRLQRDLPALRAAGRLVRQELEAGRSRTGELNATRTGRTYMKHQTKPHRRPRSPARWPSRARTRRRPTAWRRASAR